MSMSFSDFNHHTISPTYTRNFSIQNKKYVLLDNHSLYDTFYASVYDSLLLEPKKNAFDVSEKLHYTNTKNKRVLDIGCGTGHHCDQFNRQNFKCIGLDKSKAMINKAKKIILQHSLFMEMRINLYYLIRVILT